jgi:hypothetical protein
MLVVSRLMRVISSMLAVLILGSFPLALRIWSEVDPHFSSRGPILGPLAILFALTGTIAAFIAIALAAKRRPVSVGFSVYALLHGAGCLYLTWRSGYGPSMSDLLAGTSICVGLRALMMIRKKHGHVA